MARPVSVFLCISLSSIIRVEFSFIWHLGLSFRDIIVGDEDRYRFFLLFIFNDF